MSKKYWMVKQEPETYSWDDLVSDGQTDWTGVRNFQARNNLRAMSVGDHLLFYHSGKEKAVIGIAEVIRGAYADPTATEGDWVAVDVKAVRKFSETVPLASLRADTELTEVPLLKQTQLSVMPLTKAQFDRITRLGKSAGK